MNKLGLNCKSQEPYYVLEIKDESNESSNSNEYEFSNHEHDYCIREVTKNVIYLNQSNDAGQLQTLANVEPNLVFLTYLPNEVSDGNESTNVIEGIPDGVGNTVQLYGANGLVQDVFVQNGDIDLEVPGETITTDIQDQDDNIQDQDDYKQEQDDSIQEQYDNIQDQDEYKQQDDSIPEQYDNAQDQDDYKLDQTDSIQEQDDSIQEQEDNIQDQEDIEQLEHNLISEADVVHKVNGTEIWIMVEGPAKDGTVNNVNETQVEHWARDDSVFSNETYAADASQWILRKPKVKVTPHRRIVSAKSLDKEINEEVKHKAFKKVSISAIKKAQKRSWVWKYFSKQGEVIYQCSLCGCNLSIKGCNTNNMNRHIRTKHLSIYNMEVESKPVVIGDNENGDKNDAEHLLVCNTYKPPLHNTEDNDGLFKQRWRSWVWWLFDQVSPTVARCKICKRKIAHGGTATGNLNRHIKLLHKSVYLEVATSNKFNRRPSQKETSPESDEIVLDLEDVNSFEEAWENFQCKEILRKKTLSEQ